MYSKRMRKLLGCATLGLLMLTQNVYAAAYGNINVSTVNMRAGASTDDAIVTQVGPKDYIHITNKVNNEWYAVETESNQSGYINAQFIDLQKARVVVNENSVNVRKSPDYNAPVIAQLYKNNKVYAYSQTGEWYMIVVDGTEGYVHRDFIDGTFLDQLPNKKAVATSKSNNTKEATIAVATTTLNLRSTPSTSASIVKKVAPASVLSVVNIGDEWVQVTDSNQTSGYIAKEFLNIGKESAKNELLKGISQGGLGDQVVAYAKQFVGNPYVYGGTSLTNGVDCSGFTLQVFKKFGITLNRNSASQYSNNGYSVSQSEAQAGDLIFYGYGGSVSHVGIYMGDGQVVHANDERTGICITSAFRPTGKPVIGIKRVL